MHCIILHAVMDFTTELRCLATHTHTHTHSLSAPLYLAISIFHSLLLRTWARAHTHTHTYMYYIYTYTGIVTTTEHIIVTDFWSFGCQNKSSKHYSKPMLLLKARSSSSDVLRDISSKVQVASNIWFSWDINLGTKCTNIHCSWPVCEWRWYQCSLETTFHGYTRHLPSWDLYVYMLI